MRVHFAACDTVSGWVATTQVKRLSLNIEASGSTETMINGQWVP